MIDKDFIKRCEKIYQDNKKEADALLNNEKEWTWTVEDHCKNMGVIL